MAIPPPTASIRSSAWVNAIRTESSNDVDASLRATLTPDAALSRTAFAATPGIP